MVDDLFQRGDLAGMHIGRARGGPSQRRRLEGPLQFLAVGQHETQFGTVVLRPVAEGAEAIERVLDQLLNNAGPAPILGQARYRRHGGVVEMVVCKARTIVAVDAVGLADEQPQSLDLERRQRVVAFRRAARRDRIGEAVEPRRLMADGTLKGVEGLADIGKYGVDRKTVLHGHRIPGRPRGLVALRPGALGKALHVGQGTENRFVALAIRLRHVAHQRGAVRTMLDRVLQRPQRLAPQAVLAPVPELPGAVGHIGERHGASIGGADALCKRHIVLELPLRQVAGRAGDLAIRAHPGIEEQPGAERCGHLAVGHAVCRVRRQVAQRRERQRGDDALFLLCEIGLAATGQQDNDRSKHNRCQRSPPVLHDYSITRLNVTPSSPAGEEMFR